MSTTLATPDALPAAVASPRAVRACMYTFESRRGHARYTRDLLSALAVAGAPRGVEVSLVTGVDLAPPFRSPLYPIHSILPSLKERALFRNTLHWGVSRFTHHLERERAFLRWLDAHPDLDLVHFQEYTPWLAPTQFRALRRRGLKIVVTVHNIANYAHASRAYMRLSQRCWRSAWRTCSALLVHTDGLRSTLADLIGPGCPPIHVTPHAVWEERPSPAPIASPPDLNEPARLLFFGVIRPLKGLHVLLEALKRLPHCTLTIAGETDHGVYYHALRDQAAALPDGQVEFVSRFIEEREIASYFDASHLVVLPYTEFASQSGVLHQALTHGKPVVVADVGGLGESVRRWGNGEVVPPADPAALALGIERALRPSSYDAAARASARVRDDLSWAKMAEATLDVYRGVLA